LDVALTGGDDYEILCCVGSGGARFAAATRASGAPCARIGELIAGNRETIFLDEQGKTRNFNRLSFSHF
jgi:thiamine-monophosphate kinase